MGRVPAVVLVCAMLGGSPVAVARVAGGLDRTSSPAEQGGRGRDRPVQTREALDRYLLGDYQVVVPGPHGLTRFDTRDAERWITAGGPAAVERRRLAAALVALEYAGVRPALLPSLIGWGREMFARQPPGRVEAQWLRASIALAQGLDRWVFLLVGVAAPPERGVPPVAPVGHVRFARLRFPDDPYFQMAEGIGAELSASRPLDRLSVPPPQSSTGWDRVEADLVEAGGAGLEERAATLDRAAGLFDRLITHPELSAEAHLRLGYVRLRQGGHDVALAHFDRVAYASEDQRLRYLGHLFSGWVLGSVNRVNEATIAYRAALRFVPHAQSATTLLVALLTRNDQLDEAEAVADAFLAADREVEDPWRLYYIGDFPAYADLVRRLREELN